MLANCEAEFDEFIARMSLLKEKLGRVLFQFPHFSKYEFERPQEFLQRLRAFLKRTREMCSYKFAVQIRNNNWLTPLLTDVLGHYRVALALTDTSFMPRPWEHKQKLTYVRWLGDRRGIEEMTRTWDKIIVDRRDDLLTWVEAFRQFSDGIQVYTYANNHYAGKGPETHQSFLEVADPGISHVSRFAHWPSGQ